MKHINNLTGAFVTALLVSGLTLSVVADHHEEKKDPKKPKTIEDVMETTHKGRDSIVSHVRDGKGTPEEIALLVTQYNFLAKQKPPEGDADSWKKKTVALIKTIKDVQQKKPNAVAAYKEAVNCKACHEVHKPKDY